MAGSVCSSFFLGSADVRNNTGDSSEGTFLKQEALIFGCMFRQTLGL